MRNRAKRVETIGNDLKILTSEAMLKELVNVTPVDTSAALSNWQVGVGSPPIVVTPAYVQGSRGSSKGASAARALDIGNALIATVKPGQPLFLSNSIAYIGDLNRGTSPQFGGGFIARALIVFRLELQESMSRLLRFR
jgi:hypothetical protein